MFGLAPGRQSIAREELHASRDISLIVIIIKFYAVCLLIAIFDKFINKTMKIDKMKPAKKAMIILRLIFGLNGVFFVMISPNNDAFA